LRERRSNDRCLFAIGALELFAPSTVAIYLAVGDHNRLVGLGIIAVSNRDIFTAPLDVTQLLRHGIAELLLKRKMREHFAKAYILALEAALELRLDVSVLLNLFHWLLRKRERSGSKKKGQSKIEKFHRVG